MSSIVAWLWLSHYVSVVGTAYSGDLLHAYEVYKENEREEQAIRNWVVATVGSGIFEAIVNQVYSSNPSFTPRQLIKALKDKMALTDQGTFSIKCSI